jgi:hypothetical protein
MHDLAGLRESREHRNALSALVNVDVTAGISDTALVRALLEAGVRAVEREVEDQGYARIAAEIETRRRQALARRRRRRWADD